MLLKPRLALASTPGFHGRLSNTQKSPGSLHSSPGVKIYPTATAFPEYLLPEQPSSMQRPPFPSVPPLHPWKWRLTASFLSPLACPPPPSPADTQVEKPQISAGQPEPSTTVLFPSTLLIRVRAVRGPSVSHSLRFSCRKSIFSLPSSFLRLTRISIRVSLPLHPLRRPPLPPLPLLLPIIIVHKKMLPCH